MDDRFVPLAVMLRANVRANAATAVPEGALGATESPSAIAPSHDARPSNVVDFAHADVVHELTMLRLEAMEAFERRARRLVDDLAHDVLARELALAPVDVGALVERALAAFADHEPIALVVASSDLERVRTSLPVRADSALGAGDLIVYVRDGAFESSFAFRRAEVVERGLASDAR